MRPAIRQPIYLAKLKKRDKENPIVYQHKPQDSIYYDLMLFQQSLQINGQINVSGPDTARSSCLTKKPLVENKGFINQTCNFGEWNMDGGKNLKWEATLRATAPVFEKCKFNNTCSQVKNIHRTHASVKPKTKGISQTFINVKALPTSNQLTFHKPDPQIPSQYGVQVMANKLKVSDSAQNEHLAEDMVKKAYQKVGELQQLKNKNAQHIKKLQDANQMHQQQNFHLLKRIQDIQSQFDQLMIHHDSLRNLQNYEQSTNQVVALTFHSEQSSQTDHEIESKPTQTLSKSHNQASRPSLQLTHQDLLLRAKQLKNQLEQQKIHSTNLEISFKTMLQKKQIQWRQKIESMQRHMQSLNKKYESKCIQVKQKEYLITRLIQK